MAVTTGIESTNLNETIPDADRFLDWLDERIQNIMNRLISTEAWSVMTAENVDRNNLISIIREVYLEIVWYQEDAISGAISAIGRLPRAVSPKLIQSMLVHQADEFDHGLMARRDFLALDGDESRTDKINMSPSACAVASFWNYAATRMDPFAYLGALYLFEGLTPWISESLLTVSKRVGFPSDACEFGEFHAVEDVQTSEPGSSSDT